MSYNNDSSGNSVQKRQERILVDMAIRAKMVLVIDQDNVNLGIMSLTEALNRAYDQGMNLMQMSAPIVGRPPTCKILDYGKYKYDESKRLKAQNKKQRESQVDEKELTFRPDTAINDLKTKARKAIEFLDSGARLKVTIKCVGREVTHPDVFRHTLNEFLQLIPGATATPISNELRGRFSYQISRSESDTTKK